MAFKSKFNVFPKSGVLLALDYGDRRFGTARSDRSRQFAFAGEMLALKAKDQPEQNWGALIEYLKPIIADYEVVGIIIGYPLNMDGEPGPQSEKVERLAKFIETELQLPVRLQDERLSTFEAKQRTGSDSGVDAVAAQVILESFLGIRY